MAESRIILDPENPPVLFIYGCFKIDHKTAVGNDSILINEIDHQAKALIASLVEEAISEAARYRKGDRALNETASEGESE